MKTEIFVDGVKWSLEQPVGVWLDSLSLEAAASVSNALETLEISSEAHEFFVPEEHVASWPERAALDAGLPANSPLGFDVRLSGVLGKPGASIEVRWLQPGKTITARDVKHDGLWLHWREKTFRVPSPIFDALKLIAEFADLPGDSPDTQFRHWAHIREALGEPQLEQITDAYLRSFRVVTASALTFSITTDEDGQIQLDPVLMAERRADEGDREEYVRALTEAEESLFPKRLDQLRSGVSAFPLSQGSYVVVDEGLQRTLGAVKRLRSAPLEQRKRAAMLPEAVIREMLDLPDDEPVPFVETERFAERVLDVGDWRTPVLPWVKIATQDWSAPIESGIRIDGKDIPLDIKQVQEGIHSLEQARATGRSHGQVGSAQIAATEGNLKALRDLEKALERRQQGKPGKGDDDGAEPSKVLIIETNFEEISFNRTLLGKRRGVARLPSNLKTSPKHHQATGLRWMQSHWLEGSRGAMLCDDMGLGKTFQALAFCSWVKELIDQGLAERKPMLIVAPVGLLRNWEAEIDLHLLPPGLGRLTRAYGSHLRELRRGKHIDGSANLDTARLAASDVVLANYEAVSDYQISFGAVPFSLVVLDEAQKIKSPRARMTHAAKALNVDFVLAMTGTPVENRLADLWCIADAVQPGVLGDLKAFSSTFEAEGADPQALREHIWQEEQEAFDAAPKMLLRRLKTDKLDGLPPRHEHVLKRPMPVRQEEAYLRALKLGEVEGPEGTLGMIHSLRRVSLHPALLDGPAGLSGELCVEDSARLSAAIETLDRIAEKGEKALIFLESLDLQDADQLPMLLKRRYGLRRSPMVINGQVSAEKRQASVDAFQSESGFDVMLLSPKAGGVGLTLTAANHVIHLSRWWNPAVEDQCSDRVYRIGQSKPVHVYYPLATLPAAEEHSFDVQLQRLMDRKRHLAQQLLTAPAFTPEDYEDLLARTRLD